MHCISDLNVCWAEEIGLAVMLKTCICEELGSNFSCYTGSWLRIFMVFHIPFRQMLEQYPD
jgi:hypothetical protein